MDIYVTLATSGVGSPSTPGTGWGGGPLPSDSEDNITVYAWDKDPAVTFSCINQTIVVDPRSYSEDTAGAQSAADDFCAEATTIQGGGGKACFRYWQEDSIADGAILGTDWWDTLEPYDNIPVDSTMQSWWADFNARVTSNAVIPDYKLHDFEDGLNYFLIDTEASRQDFFDAVTVSGGPYPNSPNPYIGASIWSYSDPLTDQFIQEWNQDAIEKRKTFLQFISNACPVANNNYSNYNDYIQSYEVGNLRNRENRLPEAQVRMSDITALPTYLDWDEDEELTDPEAAYDSTRQAINRRRWKKMIWRLNKNASAATAGSRVHPWIAPPGYGYNGHNTWAPEAWLPFEKLLWRVQMRHLRAQGIDTFILWNPDTNPNAEDTDTFMDAYFDGLTVRSNVPSVIPANPITGETVVTLDRVTRYQDLYRLDYVWVQRAASPIEPFSQGFCTQAEPLIINAGATGDQELLDFYAALELVYGSESGDPDAYVTPGSSEVTGLEPLPE